MDRGGLIPALCVEASRIEEDANYSGKSHLNAAGVWSRRHYWLGVPATVAGALAGAAIVKEWQTVAALLSLSATILTGLITFLKPNDRASLHKAAGDQYLALRNDARIFREIEVQTVQDETVLTKGLRMLAARRNDLNKGSPNIPRKAFEQARRGIEEGESLHQIDTACSK